MNLFSKTNRPAHIRPLEVKGNLKDAATPQLIRQTWKVVFFSLVPLFAWAALSPIQEVAHVPGQVVPSGSVRMIQHMDGGEIDQVLVEDNMVVEAGQVLFVFDNVMAQSELDQVASRLSGLQARTIRIQAFIAGRMPDFSSFGVQHARLVEVQKRIFKDQVQALSNDLAVGQTQIDRKRSELRELQASLDNAMKQVALTRDMVKIRQSLVEQQALSRVVYLETVRANVTAQGNVERYKKEIENIRNAISEAESRNQELRFNAKREANDELSRITDEIAQVQQQYNGLKQRVSHLELRAPVRGIVQELNITSKVVRPGGVLAKIVPLDDQLWVEIRIDPDDIGRVSVNTPVVIKLSSYSFVNFGQISGLLTEISRSSLMDENSRVYYKGMVKIEKNYLGDTPGLYPVLPGMLAQVDIALDQRKILEVLLRPLTSTVNNAFKER
ncbi:MAG: HlyD family type I secretion periplasmic adaptor subunit [Magnetococcales bacterium]|nr:HlyD family type I secretion periplasmic adaptor subunit [Magnetococcales bacterium]